MSGAADNWVVFDLNGTLIDPSGLFPAHDRGFGRRCLQDTVLRAIAVTLSGGYEDFSELLRQSIQRRLGREGLPATLLDDAIGRSERLPLFAEATAALDAFADAGFRLAIVTNSASEAAERQLEHAGILARFDLVFGTDAVRAFKPDRRVYEAARERIGMAGGELWLVAAHGWDVLGADSAGWKTAWSSHLEGEPTAGLPSTTLTADGLSAVAAAVAAHERTPRAH